MEKLEIFPLHRNPSLVEDCLFILNSQWPRSRTLRQRSLNSSCDGLPTSLVLTVTNHQYTQLVIGHLRINTLPSEDRGVWIESVVIRKEFRGQGYGKVLMEKTEQYVRGLGFETCFLSTTDQQGFYSKLGYKFCSPVCLYGGNVNKNLLPKNFLGPISNSMKHYQMQKIATSTSNTSTKTSTNSITSPIITSIPPAPPLPTSAKIYDKSNIIRIDGKQTKVYMTKSLW